MGEPGNGRLLMATINAAATGNWSATATWTGGVIPGPADDVNSSGKTITIDQDITVNSITNPTGGSFVVSSVASIRNLTVAQVITPGQAAILTISAPSGTVNVNTPGISGGSAPSTPCIVVSGAATLNLGAASVAGGAGGSHGINATASATITAGAVTGGTGGYGLYITAGASVAVASVAAGAAVGAYLSTAATAAVLNVSGAVSASSSAPAIKSDAVNVVRLRGPLSHGASNYAPIQAPCWMVYAGQTTTWTVKDDSASPNTGASVVLSNALAGTPAPSDVRSGVAFGGGNSLTGTLAVPPAGSVASGVPVDATTGTAALALSQVATVLGDQIAAALTA